MDGSIFYVLVHREQMKLVSRHLRHIFTYHSTVVERQLTGQRISRSMHYATLFIIYSSHSGQVLAQYRKSVAECSGEIIHHLVNTKRVQTRRCSCSIVQFRSHRVRRSTLARSSWPNAIMQRYKGPQRKHTCNYCQMPSFRPGYKRATPTRGGRAIPL